MYSDEWRSDLQWIDTITCIWLDANVGLQLDVDLDGIFTLDAVGGGVLYLENVVGWGYGTQHAGGTVKYTD